MILSLIFKNFIFKNWFKVKRNAVFDKGRFSHRQPGQYLTPPAWELSMINFIKNKYSVRNEIINFC